MLCAQLPATFSAQVLLNRTLTTKDAPFLAKNDQKGPFYRPITTVFV